MMYQIKTINILIKSTKPKIPKKIHLIILILLIIVFAKPN